MENNDYLARHRKKLKIDSERENYIFGICIGFILIFANLLFFFKTGEYKYVYGIYLSQDVVDVLDVINISLIIFGGLMVLAVTVYPSSVKLIYNIFKFVLSKIGVVLLNIILSIIYYLIVFPIGIVIHLRDNVKTYDTNFKNYEEANIKLERNIMSILLIFKSFFRREYILILPVVILLISLGIVLFFAQSSMLAPFIYTLF